MTRPTIRSVLIRARDLRVDDIMSVTDRQGRHHAWRRVTAVHQFDKVEAVSVEFHGVSGGKRYDWHEPVTIQTEAGPIA